MHERQAAGTRSFLDDLDEMLADALVVGSVADEARGNLWVFSLTQARASTMTTEEVLDFLHAIIERREQQLLEHAGDSRPMVFYCWFDEQAAQLRFSVASCAGDALPFTNPVHVVADLASVVANFLASPYHDGFPLAEMGEVAFSSPLDEQVRQEQRPVDVWLVRIPGVVSINRNACTKAATGKSQ